MTDPGPTPVPDTVPARGRRTLVAIGLGALALSGLVVAIAVAARPRIERTDELPAARRVPAARRELGVLHLGVPPIFALDELERAYGPARGYLGRRLGVDVRLVTADTYAALGQALEDGAVDVALLPPAAAAALLRRAPDRVAPVAIALRGGETSYPALLVAREDGPRTLADVRGRKVAFTSKDSLSGWIAPGVLLRGAGIRTADLGEVVLAGNHTAALDALADGRVDVAATYPAALAALQARRPDLRLREVAHLNGLPNDLALVRSDLPDALRAALVAALTATDEDGPSVAFREGLRRAGIDGFAPAPLPAELARVQAWLDESP